jgi:hypothetical protein
MTGPNLGAAVRALERLMSDACTITPAVDKRDQVLDPETLELTDLDPEPAIYTGKCFVTSPASAASVRRGVDRAGKPQTKAAVSLHIPVGSPTIPKGALVTITASQRNPHLVGAHYHVEGPIGGSYVASQPLALEPVF